MADKATENVTNETRAEALREYVQAYREAQRASGKKAKVLQKWAKAGIPAEVLKEAVKVRDMDPQEVMDLDREKARMKALIIPEYSKTMDMFGDKLDTSLKGSAATEMSAWEAEDAGYLAGKAGRPIDSSPYNHQPGSELFVKWRDGWQKGQADIAYEMGPEAKQASDERRPRGRPRKEPAPEKTVEDPVEGTA